MVHDQMQEFGEMEESESLNDVSDSSLSMHGNMYYARQTPQKSVMNKIQGSQSSQEVSVSQVDVDVSDHTGKSS